MDINSIHDDDVRREIRKRGYGIDHAHGMALAITEKTGEVRATDGLPRWKGIGGVKRGTYMKILRSSGDAKEAAELVIAEVLTPGAAKNYIRGARQKASEASNMDRSEVSKIAAEAVAQALSTLGIDDETVETLRTLKQGKRRAPRKKATAKKKAPAKKGTPEPAAESSDEMTAEEQAEWGVGDAAAKEE